jgi:Fe2+ or Zn2+ uptake regulation protein
MLRRLDEEGVRLTGRRELVVNAIGSKPGSFTPEALVDELRRTVSAGRRCIAHWRSWSKLAS